MLFIGIILDNSHQQKEGRNEKANNNHKWRNEGIPGAKRQVAEDRFEVTEAAVKRLKEENERLRAKSIRNDSYMSEILNSGDGVYRP